MVSTCAARFWRQSHRWGMGGGRGVERVGRGGGRRNRDAQKTLFCSYPVPSLSRSLGLPALAPRLEGRRAGLVPLLSSRPVCLCRCRFCGRYGSTEHCGLAGGPYPSRPVKSNTYPIRLRRHVRSPRRRCQVALGFEETAPDRPLELLQLHVFPRRQAFARPMGQTIKDTQSLLP